MRPIHYLVIFIFCAYFVYLANLTQAFIWFFYPDMIPSTFVAMCGVLMYLLTMYLESIFTEHDTTFEDLI